jgi:hypothetical protein
MSKVKVVQLGRTCSVFGCCKEQEGIVVMSDEDRPPFHQGCDCQMIGYGQSRVNHPDHYNQFGIECIDVIEGLGLGFHLGSALKYIWRADSKGAAIEDLEKAVWYLQREIARRKRTPGVRQRSEDNGKDFNRRQCVD